VLFVKTFHFPVKNQNRKKLFELVRGMSSTFLTIEKGPDPLSVLTQ